ncbi:M23 family metallopeptidase [Enterococcus sp. BWR-S5]|uniref:M23 family metallopeptidase n=1 Tax=Enterococcus sp. BWR-S5 TaxID=2787714 RepID=UPI001920A947|nr:M23 family metallopeptidase [Enterococcus sp. BWR-S5]MBL1226280.1 M23 family metallopeptidase [Enterococcus sp. BWR-S5]
MERAPVVIEFPLRGEWQAPTTPKKQIPSHGTNRLGLRYAFDFLQVNYKKRSTPFHRLSAIRYFLFGVPLKDCYCWGEPIYAPCDGKVVMLEDGIRERKIVHWFVDSMIAIKNALFFNEEKDAHSKIAGNYVVINYGKDGYMAFAHLQKDSIAVTLNQEIKKGDYLGKVGHSGNSTAPHLHFQLMDSQDIAHSQGIPCLFEQYEVYQNDGWQMVYNQMPSETDRIRFIK